MTDARTPCSRYVSSPDLAAKGMFGAAHELLSDQKRDPSWKPLEIDDREELVLSAADEFFDNADGCEPDNPLLNAASSWFAAPTPSLFSLMPRSQSPCPEPADTAHDRKAPPH